MGSIEAEKLKRLVELWAAGSSITDIANELGVTRSVISGKIRRLGLQRGERKVGERRKKAHRVIEIAEDRPDQVSPPKLKRCHNWGKPQRTQAELRAMLAEAVRNTIEWKARPASK